MLFVRVTLSIPDIAPDELARTPRGAYNMGRGIDASPPEPTLPPRAHALAGAPTHDQGELHESRSPGIRSVEAFVSTHGEVPSISTTEVERKRAGILEDAPVVTRGQGETVRLLQIDEILDQLFGIPLDIEEHQIAGRPAQAGDDITLLGEKLLDALEQITGPVVEFDSRGEAEATDDQ